jgi:hypothetical protein
MFDSEKIITNQWGETDTYQGFYESGRHDFLDASYMMLWNFQGYDTNLNQRPFKGPGLNSRNTLLLCDILYRGELHQPDLWRSSHPIPGGSKSAYNPLYSATDREGTAARGMKLNAAYTDGSVVRITAEEETVSVVTEQVKYANFRIPERFK